MAARQRSYKFITENAVLSKFRLVLLLLASTVQGGFMLFDGIHKLATGTYFGHQLGPWARLVSLAGINPDSLGPVFVFLGCLWLVSGALALRDFRRCRPLLIVLGCVCLAYLPFGTLLSLLTIGLAVSAKTPYRYTRSRPA